MSWRPKVTFSFTPASVDVKWNLTSSWKKKTEREKQHQCFIDLLSLTFFSTPWHKDTHTLTHSLMCTTHCVSPFVTLPHPVKASIHLFPSLTPLKPSDLSHFSSSSHFLCLSSPIVTLLSLSWHTLSLSHTPLFTQFLSYFSLYL